METSSASNTATFVGNSANEEASQASQNKRKDHDFDSPSSKRQDSVPFQEPTLASNWFAVYPNAYNKPLALTSMEKKLSDERPDSYSPHLAMAAYQALHHLQKPRIGSNKSSILRGYSIPMSHQILGIHLRSNIIWESEKIVLTKLNKSDYIDDKIFGVVDNLIKENQIAAQFIVSIEAAALKSRVELGFQENLEKMVRKLEMGDQQFVFQLDGVSLLAYYRTFMQLGGRNLSIIKSGYTYTYKITHTFNHERELCDTGFDLGWSLRYLDDVNDVPMYIGIRWFDWEEFHKENPRGSQKKKPNALVNRMLTMTYVIRTGTVRFRAQCAYYRSKKIVDYCSVNQ